MSKFVEMCVAESWRTVVDRIPLVGSKIVDKLTKPTLDKIMKDPKLRAYIKKQTHIMFNDMVSEYKQEFRNNERTISLTKPAKYDPLASERDVRGIDVNAINYEYTIDGVKYRVTTDGTTIRRVYFAFYECITKDNHWFESLVSLYAPSKAELAKMWKPISDGEYLDSDD